MGTSRLPTISIITPAYNAAAFLSETIESALAQTFQDFELIVSDDGSTDGTLELAREWERKDPRIRVVTGRNAGSSAARNRAMQRARGAFFALLDCDDLWMPEFLSSQMAVFDQYPHADIVTGNAYNLGGPFDGQPLQPAGSACRELSFLEILENEDAVCIMSVFRRSVFNRIGGFDGAVLFAEDYDYWVRAVHAGLTIVANPVPLAHYRRRPESKTGDTVSSLNGAIMAYRHARALCVGRPAELEAIERQLARFEKQWLLECAKVHLLKGEFAAATGNLERLSTITRGVNETLLARISRHVPRVLLWAYRTKGALRTLRRPAAHHARS